MRHRTSILTLSFIAAVTLASSAFANPPISSVAVAPQYDTTHVYVAPAEVDTFVQAFLGTFGGQSTPQVVATVTPTPSSTTSQLLQTPAGTVSLFGFKTPVPYPFGLERNGYLVRDLDIAVKAARDAGANVIVEAFPDPIGRDAVIQWPGGLNMQLYWHTKHPDYKPLETIPENRAYIPPGAVDEFLKDFLTFSGGKVVADDKDASAAEIGKPRDKFRRIEVQSDFGRMLVLVSDGHLPYPYGYETTGYEVQDLQQTLEKAKKFGVNVLVPPHQARNRQTSIVQFPGGYIAEVHAVSK
ncbi:glyoxalase [Rhizobium sp. NPDC090275]|uniref:glyoxalase n=1 Tax=Rhizobium sp. NPDC090275 TaxID=3364498 RepID=UPI00383B5906